ncbi:tRNA (guanosine-2'-O-)-methyltransferase [Lutibacter oricola]|uniref:tRNA (guanosine(18)-2'-O)-methyltransferase n=1 Tax=Lutibacter oricola TaxID=762486 RepID=A0A1H2XPT4_9FLAO|nr:RNA methyltransferase [Lutibacter oricola]SDW94815.1 tRNA (guanosine-2'-O-)-methyltransferase [Lutibacter oricola]
MVDYKYSTYLEQFVTEKRRNLFRTVLNQRTNHFTVAIEDLFQPHNASAVVRTCDIFGIQEINVIENKYKFYASRHVAKGAQKWLDFNYYREKDTNNTKVCMDELRAKGYQIIATTPHNESCYLEDFDVTKKSAFFFGVEKEGLSKEVLDNADGYLKIPMAGFTESLNISVAAAIILQRFTEKLKATDVHWQLSDLEKDAKYIEWMEKTIKSIKKIKENYYNTIAIEK